MQNGQEMHDVTIMKSVLPNPDSEDDFERICSILLPDRPLDDEDDEFEPPEATMEMLSKYHEFLLPLLKNGLELTGMEMFPWEEKFYFGYGSEKEHASIRKNKCSSKDKVTFMKFLDFNESEGLLVEVKRVSDGKIFILPLGDLEVCRKRSKEHQLVEDYSVWFTNFIC
jgi:hypothetical protein